MLLLSILATLSAQPVVQPEPLRIQAKASVRILRSVSVRVGDARTLEGKPLRNTHIRSAEGHLVLARLAEFE